MKPLAYLNSSINVELLDKYNLYSRLKDYDLIYDLEHVNDNTELIVASYSDYKIYKEIIDNFRSEDNQVYIMFKDASEVSEAFRSLEITRPYRFIKGNKYEPGEEVYDVTSKGDTRFSPFFMYYQGLSIEDFYQLEIKRYGLFGYKSWKDVKGRPPVQIIPVTGPWTREEVAADKDYLYLFTDNLNRSSGRPIKSRFNPINAVPVDSDYYRVFGNGRILVYPSETQAVIRGLDNACPISTMMNQYQVQLNNLAGAKMTWDKEIEYIINKFRTGKYLGIKFSKTTFGNGRYSRMTPNFLMELTQRLRKIGIDNTMEGAKPVEVESLPEVYYHYFCAHPTLLFELASIGLTKSFWDRFYTSSNSQAEIYANLLNKLFKL